MQKGISTMRVLYHDNASSHTALHVSEYMANENTATASQDKEQLQKAQFRWQ